MKTIVVLDKFRTRADQVSVRSLVHPTHNPSPDRLASRGFTDGRVLFVSGAIARKMRASSCHLMGFTVHFPLDLGCRYIVPIEACYSYNSYESAVRTA